MFYMDSLTSYINSESHKEQVLMTSVLFAQN